MDIDNDRSGIDWRALEKSSRQPGSRTYQARTCPDCGKTVREGAFSGADGNWRKHVTACPQRDTRS